MGRTILMRHAEAGPADRDEERPLSPRGRGQAHRMGSWLLDMGWVPDAALASPARRAQETAALVLTAIGAGVSAATVDGLYSDGADAYLEAVRSDASCLLVVGHNPSIEQAVSQLADSPWSMPPACAACFEDGRLVHLREAV